MTRSEFRELVAKRLEYLAKDDQNRQDIEDLADFCHGYEFTDEILKYMDDHPNATMKELWTYFDETVPPGLAPGDDGADLLDDDDDDEEE